MNPIDLVALSAVHWMLDLPGRNEGLYNLLPDHPIAYSRSYEYNR